MLSTLTPYHRMLNIALHQTSQTDLYFTVLRLMAVDQKQIIDKGECLPYPSYKQLITHLKCSN